MKKNNAARRMASFRNAASPVSGFAPLPVVLSIALLAALLAGCTVKTPPAPTVQPPPEALQDARQALDQGDYASSAALFEAILNSGTARPGLEAEYGASLVGAGRDKDALPPLGKAIQMAPQDAATFYNRGLAYLHLQQYDNAIYEFRKAADLNRGQIRGDSLSGMGLAFAAKGEADIAVQNLNAALAMQETPLRHFNRGVAYLGMRLYEAAEQDFTNTLDAQPNNAEAYNNRGVSRLGQGLLDGAEGDFTKAIELDGTRADYYFNRGIARQRAGLFRQAATDYTYAIGREPDNAEAYNNRGIASLSMSLTEEGCRDLQHACELGLCVYYENSKKKKLCP